MFINPSLILFLISNFAMLVIIILIWITLIKIFIKRKVKFSNIFELKSIEFYTISVILLLFSIIEWPLPSFWSKPLIESLEFIEPEVLKSITYIFVITLLLFYIFYIEDETTNIIKDNKSILKLMLNTIPHRLSIITIGLWALYFMSSYTILLEIMILVLWYLLFTSAAHIILFTFCIISDLLSLNIKLICNES